MVLEKLAATATLCVILLSTLMILPVTPAVQGAFSASHVSKGVIGNSFPGLEPTLLKWNTTSSVPDVRKASSTQLNFPQPVINLMVEPLGGLTFPNLEPWPRRVMIPVPLKISLSATNLDNYDAATIRVYTMNDPADPNQVHMGMMGHLDPEKTVPIKVWTPNFGSDIDGNGDGIPDLDNDINWHDNNNAKWIFAFDKNQPITETWWSQLPPDNPFYDPQCAWCHPMFNYVDLFKWSDYHDRQDIDGDFVYHLPKSLKLTYEGEKDNRIPLYIAADFTDALPQSYSTTLTIEFALSNDAGDTIIEKAIASVIISATVPGNGQPINWLFNRVDMRPDMDSSTITIEKLADSNQEQQDLADSGWAYDQALAIMALTARGHDQKARQILSGLQYLQNDDGSWFFSYMTLVTDEMIQEWATSDETTLYDGAMCLLEATAGSNGYPDELEKRVCSDTTHPTDPPYPDQFGPWLFADYANAISPQTETKLPDKIKYRVADFRKFTGSIAWVVMAANFYELQTGDDAYRPMVEKAVDWLNNQRDMNMGNATYGALSMGRVWYWWAVSDTVASSYGFSNSAVYITEHNLDAYSAYRGLGLITGNEVFTQSATMVKTFLLEKLWAPHITISDYPGLIPEDIEDVFFAAINMADGNEPHGIITPCIFLDGQSWAVLALDGDTQVKDRTGMTVTLDTALKYLEQAMLVTDVTIFSGTGYEVSGIDGYKENDGDSACEFSEENLVWSEGSEGVVAAYHWIDETDKANEYHAETESYMMTNGGVPYSNLPANPDSSLPGNPDTLVWSWTDTNAIAGTAWFVFNEPSVRLNPFQYWAFESKIKFSFLPVIFKN